MTTIATDGRVMAGDGLANVQGIVTSRSFRKVHRLDDGTILGGCGSLEDLNKVVAWMNGAEKPDVGDNFGALLLSSAGVMMCSDRLEWHAIEVPAALGSGMTLALGAMLAGAAPAHAVAIASERDTYTGGTIQMEAL